MSDRMEGAALFRRVRAARPSSVAAALSCLLCSALFLSGCGLLGEGSEAACGQGLPRVEPSRAAPGETFVVRGGGFGGGCDDSNLPFRPEPPQRNIAIEMRQGGKTWRLATVDAGPAPRYGIEATLRVPEGAKPGRTVVVVNAGEEANDRDPFVPLPVRFGVLGGGSG